MEHLILNKGWKIIIYFIWWMILGTIYFLLLYIFINPGLKYSLIDSITHISLLGIISIGLWYFIRYNRLEDRNTIRFIINIIGAGVVLISIWLIIGRILLGLIHSDYKFDEQMFSKSFSLKIFTGVVIYLLIVLMYYLAIYYQNYRENYLRKNELAAKLKDQELSNLKSQINPHFLFNSLNSISYLIYTNPDDAHKSIVQLSDYFRYTLSTGAKQITTVKEEIDNIIRYLDIEKIRFTEKMQINAEIDKQCNDYQIPVMLLQPLVENAIKHGVYESTQKVDININIKAHKDFYTVIISNNFDPDAKVKKGKGYGLINTTERLKLIYKREDTIKIIKNNSIFEVRLSLPKKVVL